MRRPGAVRRAGPYKVYSVTDGTLVVQPTWPQFSKWNKEDGGGPGLLWRLELASEMQDWLNAPYEATP